MLGGVAVVGLRVRLFRVMPLAFDLFQMCACGLVLWFGIVCCVSCCLVICLSVCVFLGGFDVVVLLWLVCCMVCLGCASRWVYVAL